MEATRTATERLIAHAAVAGALRLSARRHPEAAKGLTKAAAFHSQRCQALMDEICAQAGIEPSTWAPL
jgi:hypothetical protein